MSKIIIALALLALLVPLNAVDNFSFNLYNQVANATNGNVIFFFE